MGEKSLVLCDTNILIEFYKENPRIVSELKSIGQENITLIPSRVSVRDSANRKSFRYKYLKGWGLLQSSRSPATQKVSGYILIRSGRVPFRRLCREEGFWIYKWIDTLQYLNNLLRPPSISVSK